MKLLVLGGTVFLGRHVVDAALDAGHRVTTFNRGLSPAPGVAGVERLVGDRDGDLAALADRSFDAVLDCSGYTPDQLRRSGACLAGRVGHYLFVSSRSVYRALGPDAEQDEAAPLLQGEEGYGALKARSEEAIRALLPGRVTIVRPGLIAGPYDPTGRFTYWPLRIARGGDVLAPGRPARPVQWIDARDLAAWCVRRVEGPAAGIHDVVGATTTMLELLEAAVRVTGSAARLHWMPDDRLLANGVEPWTGMPLWIPEDDARFGGLMRGQDARAVAAGLTCRPIEDTILATLAWALGPSAATPRAVATLPAAREAELLAAWWSRPGARGARHERDMSAA